MTNTHIRFTAKSLGLPEHKVASTAALLKEGATIPFIARYRKEATGSLDEVEIAAIRQQLQQLEELDKRKETILKTIGEQGKLTDALEKRILDTYDLHELEDIYLPYKPKRKTKASVAKEKGLEPLADRIFEQYEKEDPELLAERYLKDEVPTVEAALQGARDIIAERISEDEYVRNHVRRSFAHGAVLYAKVVKGKEEEAAKFRDYFKYEEPLARCPSHRLLAIRRGEEEGFLRVTIKPEEETTLVGIEKQVIRGRGACSKQVSLAAADAYDRLLQPSFETEFRHLSKDKADQEAIRVFADNLRQLLIAAPLGQKKILALDPGFRTGCKAVCLDANGDLLKYETIFPHPPQSERYRAEQQLSALISAFHIEAIAVGNGTAGRETMDFIKGLDCTKGLQLFMVNENGASIYSASEVAREEFPDHDLTIRGAVSIGRRLMDPLAELVKIDAKSIGVGQYQHDVNQSALKESLDGVVESCVNAVGINLNTASKHLLTYVSGLGPVLAKNIVEYRTEKGVFSSREELKKVARLGDKAFEQCAGFLRIREGLHPLDNTAVHPESYSIVEKMAKDMGCTVQELIRKPEIRKSVPLEKYATDKIGMPTLTDIMKELDKPGLDPRGEAKTFEFADVRTMSDLSVGMVIPGIITNITKFGAFVDIGVKQDGLVHISQLANKFVKDPLEVVKLQQQVIVRVLELDIARNRITLSMKDF